MKKFIILVALIVGSLWYYGRSLPREHTIRSSVIITSAKADTVFNVMRRVGNYPRWWSDVRSVRAITGMRRESWEQNRVTGGLVSVEVTSISPPGRMVTTIIPNTEDAEKEMKWGGVWKYDVFESAAGIEVQITEEGWVDPPLTRVFMKLRGRSRDVDSFLSSLAAHFGEMTMPRHLD